jgi:hypothetical protein
MILSSIFPKLFAILPKKPRFFGVASGLVGFALDIWQFGCKRLGQPSRARYYYYCGYRF